MGVVLLWRAGPYGGAVSPVTLMDLKARRDGQGLAMPAEVQCATYHKGSSEQPLHDACFT